MFSFGFETFGPGDPNLGDDELEIIPNPADGRCYFGLPNSPPNHSEPTNINPNPKCLAVCAYSRNNH
jgi:hypothetical protein